MTSKSYQQYTVIGSPFKENGKEYVLIDFKGREKKVRWYPEPFKKLRTLSSVLGFDNGFIWILEGNEEWLRLCSQTRFHVSFGWYIPSTEDLPKLLEGVIAKKLMKEEVFENDEKLRILPK